MTLSELLEELKGIDPETWNVIVRGIPLKPFCQYFTLDRCGQRAHQYPDAYLPFSQMERDVALSWIQGCIQRAIERRVDYRVEKGHETWGMILEMGRDGPEAWIWGSNGVERSGYGDSPAEALLAAYVAAAKKEQSSCQEFDTPILVDHPRYDDHSKSIPRHSTVFFNICEGEKR